jgi:hypothetical protein
MGTLFVDKLDPQSGTSLEIGSSGDTITIPSGATIANSGTATGFSSTISTPYSARMWKGTNQTISNAAWTLFDLASGTEVYDKGSIADLATSKITVPSGAAGFWVFNFFLRVNNFRADRNILQLYKNGVATSGTAAGDNFENGYWGASSQYSSLFGHLVLDLAAADYIQPYFYQNSGGSDTIMERSFSAWYLGASS